MLRSRFFWKLYASYAALVIVTSAVIGFLVVGNVESSQAERLEAELLQRAALLQPYADALFGGALDDSADSKVAELASEAGVRITFITPEGKVLIDSEEDPARMDDHSGRPEVIAALRTGSGVARRFSRTIGSWLVYAAVASGFPDDVGGVARVSISSKQVDAEVGALRGRIAAGAVIGSLVALLLGLFVAQRFTAPVTHMIRTADALRSGDFGARVDNLSADEIGVLGDALNRLGEEVTRRIAKLSADESQLRAMFVGMVEGVVAVDHADHVVFLNDAARRLLLIEPGEVTGRRIWELVRIADLDRLIEEARAVEGSARRELVLAVGMPETVLEAYAHPFDSPAARGVVVVLHDITDLRRLERVRRDFVSNVSHELKTPLTSIRGYVETLLDGALHDESANVRFLEKINQNVKRLNHLVADLLSLARIESQVDGGLQLEQVDWLPIVESGMRRHESVARAKSIECEVDAARNRAPVLGDAEAMTQIFDNLLSNAIKYTPESGSIQVRIGRHDELVQLDVEDSGIGIPPEDLGRVFERFYRVDKARSRELGGTGLGLSIVKNMVSAMRGDVTVTSEQGKGSTFSVRLPMANGR